MILEPDGTVGSCRVKGTDFSVGNLKDNTLQEIWNGPTLTEWRRQFLDGKPEFCDKEVRCVMAVIFVRITTVFFLRLSQRNFKLKVLCVWGLI